MSQNVKIAVIVACLVLAAVIFGFTSGMFSGGGSGSDDGKISFKCVNPDCNQTYSLTPDEFAKVQSDNPMATMPMMMAGPQVFKCQKCAQQSAYVAQKCPKCSTIFLAQGSSSDQPTFPDKCPKCGYSALEESDKESK